MTTRLRVLAAIVACAAVVVASDVRSQAAPVLAHYGFTSSGWTTFGLALPQGTATGGVRLGSLTTQTDVKTTWPDGSIRFAAVTAQVPSRGSYDITSSSPFAGTFNPTWPSAVVRLSVGGLVYSATLPPFDGTDSWLNGPNVRESRVQVTPVAGSVPHPYLRVFYDVRSYAGGGHRVDVTVANTLDLAVADTVVYDVSIQINGSPVYSKPALTHYYLTRWRKHFTVNLAEAAIVPDFTPFQTAQALPRYMLQVPPGAWPLGGPEFEPLQVGNQSHSMATGGGRPEIAPFPNWVAQYVVNKDDNSRQATLLNGDLFGSWDIHWTKADGVSLNTIDEFPKIWQSQNNNGENKKPAGHWPFGNGAYDGDAEHVGRLVFPPYLITGDRYYLDEMKMWGNWVLTTAYPSDSYEDRTCGTGDTSQGCIHPGDAARAVGWGVAILADNAAYLPDSDPYKSYFAAKLQNNLDYLDRMAASDTSPLGTTMPVPSNPNPPGRLPTGFVGDLRNETGMIALWEMSYVAWGIDRANRHGIAGGTSMRDKIIRLQVLLLTSAPAYDPLFGGPYELRVASPTNPPVFYTTIGQVFQATYGGAVRPIQPQAAFVGAYGADARLLLEMGRAIGIPNAQLAYDYLMNIPGLAADMAGRSGWAVLLGNGSGQTMNAPRNVRIVP